MGIVGAEEDDEIEHLNDFLFFLGQEEVPEDTVDPYEGWTAEELEFLRERVAALDALEDQDEDDLESDER